MISKLSLKLRSAVVCMVSLSASALLAQTTIHVGPGQPYASVQSGINAAADGDTVLVAPGTYYEHLNFNGKAITVTSSAGAATTILDGSGTGTVVYLNSHSSTALAILDGFTVQHGFPDSVGGTGNYNYGGAVDAGGNAIVRNNTITNNSSCGVDVLDGNVTVQNNHILNNIGANTAGANCRVNAYGILAHDNGTIRTSINLLNNLVEGNHDGGIGFFNLDASTTVNITQNIIRNNALSGSYDGGEGISMGDFASANIVGNLITGNEGQGLSQFLNNSLTLVNNTIYGNSVHFTPQYAYQGTEVSLGIVDVFAVLANNIIVGSSATNPVVYCANPATYQVSFNWDHSLIYNTATHTASIPCYNDPSARNIFVDPQLVSPATGDFHLSATSPAIDTGNDSAPLLTATDLDGKPRLQDATKQGYPIVDLGAYEYAGAQDTSPTTLTLTPSSLNPAGGSSITARLTAVSALGTPTGPVVLLEDGVAVAGATLNSSGTANFTITGLVPGFHSLIATYAGVVPYTPAESVVAILVVSKYTTNVSLTSSPNPSLLGASVLFTVKASASDNSIPSPITLTDTSTNTLLATLTPDPSGTATYSTSTLSLGYHAVQATYAGTASYAASSSSVYQNVISGNPTASTLTCLPASISINGIATLTAAVTSTAGAPTGAFAFADGGASLGQVAVNNGTASLSYQGQAAGNHTLTATFVPAAGFAGSSASCTEIVNARPSTSVLTVSPAASTYGSPVNLSVEVAPATPPGVGTPAGTVTFYNNSSPIGTAALVAGAATLTVTALPGGNDNLTCTYSGSQVYAGSNCNTVPFIVNPAPTTLSLSSSSNPASALSPVTFRASLIPAAAGNSISLTLNGQTILLTTDSSGNAAYTTSALLPGSYPVAAKYGGTASLLSSSASLTQVVTSVQTATSLTVTPNPVDFGRLVTMVATVSPQGASAQVTGGSITFFDGALPLSTQPVTASGSATLSTSTLAVGNHSITASFAGSASFVPSTSPSVTLTVLASGISLSLSQASLSVRTGHHATFHATVTSVGSFSGPVTLHLGSLPQWTQLFFTPGTVTLTPGGSADASIYLDTDAVIGYESRGGIPPSAGSTGSSPRWALLIFAPLAFAFRSRRRLRALFTLIAAVSLLSLSACSGRYPDSTTPGIYTIQVTADAQGTPESSAQLTLTVQP